MSAAGSGGPRHHGECEMSRRPQNTRAQMNTGEPGARSQAWRGHREADGYRADGMDGAADREAGGPSPPRPGAPSGCSTPAPGTRGPGRRSVRGRPPRCGAGGGCAGRSPAPPAAQPRVSTPCPRRSYGQASTRTPRAGALWEPPGPWGPRALMGEGHTFPMGRRLRAPGPPRGTTLRANTVLVDMSVSL